MHDKFCIIDKSIVLTGSTNPTVNGLTKNNNTIIVIRSKEVARAYRREYEELLTKKSSPSKNNFQNLGVFFCPEDNCQAKIISQIKNANSSIYFATFAFTDKAIATELIYAKNRGLKISGVIETRMATNSVYALLKNQGINVSKDKNPATMHHKLFIFDDETIATGSYNPTNNGNLRNDENLVIFVDNS